MVEAVVLAITIIGIPFAGAHLKLAGLGAASPLTNRDLHTAFSIGMRACPYFAGAACSCIGATRRTRTRLICRGSESSTRNSIPDG